MLLAHVLITFEKYLKSILRIDIEKIIINVSFDPRIIRRILNTNKHPIFCSVPYVRTYTANMQVKNNDFSKKE